MAKNIKSKKSWVIARTDDGTVQITYTIPFGEIKKSQDLYISNYAKDVTIAGFRKGKAPLSQVKEKIPVDQLAQNSLGTILPRLLADTLNSEKLKLAMYPKFELIKADDMEDWEVRAITCELPEIELGEYKKIISGEVRAKSLKRKLSHEEKEQLVINTLLKNIKIKIPKPLTDEEVNARLSQLVQKLEKLGVPLDKYLASINKKPEELRIDYEKQANEAITLDLALIRIADKEKVDVSQQEIDEAIKVGSADDKMAAELQSPQQRDAIKAVLTKRKTIDTLAHSI